MTLPPPASSWAGLSSVRSRGMLLWAVVVVVAVAGCIYAGRKIDWDQAWSALTQARPEWVFAGFIVNVAIFPVWASQWQVLAPGAARPSWMRMLETVSLTSLSQNFLPTIGSGATAIGMLIMRGGLSRGAAVSLLALDQMLTGVAKLAALGAAALLMPMPGWMRDGALTLVGVMVIFLGVMLALAHGTARLERWAERQGRAKKLWAILAGWTEHLDGLRKGGKPVWLGLALALVKKVLEVLAAISIQWACGIDLGWGAATLVVAALGLSTLVRTPGNFGVYEATVIAIYSALGAPPALTVAAGLLQHLVALVPRLGYGLVVLAVRRPGLAAR